MYDSAVAWMKGASAWRSCDTSTLIVMTIDCRRSGRCDGAVARLKEISVSHSSTQRCREAHAAAYTGAISHARQASMRVALQAAEHGVVWLGTTESSDIVMRRSRRRASESGISPGAAQKVASDGAGAACSDALALARKELRGLRVAVTGAGGHVGRRLLARLAEYGCDVVAMDARFSDEAEEEARSLARVERGDLRDGAYVRHALRGVDGVVHLASAGMSGADMLNRELTWGVNVDGTRNVLHGASLSSTVGKRGDLKTDSVRVVYISTVNVVYGGNRIDGGDESLPVYPLEKHTDWYSRTKAEAEVAVLSHDGRSAGDDGRALATCALRPNAIYSEHDARHLPRIAGLIRAGIGGRLAMGDADAALDWVHVENLVDAIILALAKVESTGHGRAFFVSEGRPVSVGDFTRPLSIALGREPTERPMVRIPLALVLCIARVCELAWRVLGIPPFVTRAEAFKAGVHHTFTSSLAESFLNWSPRVSLEEGMRRVARHYAEIERKRWQQLASIDRVRIPDPGAWIGIVGGVSVLALCALAPASVPEWTVAASRFVFGSQRACICVLGLIAFAHLLEAAYALKLARSMGLRSSLTAGWTVQAALLGGPSLALQREQASAMHMLASGECEERIRLASLSRDEAEVEYASWNARRADVQLPGLLSCILVVGLMAVLVVCALHPSDAPAGAMHVVRAVFGSQDALSGVLLLIVCAHLVEAVAALLIAGYVLRLSISASAMWALQTFVLGFPSLAILVGRWRSVLRSTAD